MMTAALDPGERQPLSIAANTVKTGSAQRLRIAVLNRTFSPTGGGAERYSIALVEQLAASHDIHVFAQQIDHQWPGVTYHTVSSPLLKPRWINQLWYACATWWVTRQGFDIVHSHENTWHGQVQTVHVLPVKYNLFHERTGWRWMLRWLKVVTSPRLMAYLWLERQRFSVKNHRTIVVTSRSLLTQMTKAYPATESVLRVITPGVSMVSGVTRPEQQLAARLRLGLPKTGPGILFVGNDYRKKGLAALIWALQLQPANTWLAVVGNSLQVPEFQAQARAAGVLDRVIFIGSLKDVGDAYMAADCLAHPTQEDTFAMVVLEAMAHGLPVVVSRERYCGISGLLTHETNALILNDPHDVHALAEALGRVLHESPFRHSLCAAAMDFAGNHQWGRIASQQEEIYFSVLTAAVNK